jgi:predicted transcriptional regulator YdeE
MVAQFRMRTCADLARAGQIERYGKEFDPTTGTGDIELWLPIKS